MPPPPKWPPPPPTWPPPPPPPPCWPNANAPLGIERAPTATLANSAMMALHEMLLCGMISPCCHFAPRSAALGRGHLRTKMVPQGNVASLRRYAMFTQIGSVAIESLHRIGTKE